MCDVACDPHKSLPYQAPPPIPILLHWDSSLILGELIRITGEEQAPDRVKTNCAAELHSDASPLRLYVCLVWLHVSSSERMADERLARSST